MKAKNPVGLWTTPTLVQEGKGLEDPCPFWDDNGKACLIHAYTGYADFDWLSVNHIAE